MACPAGNELKEPKANLVSYSMFCVDTFLEMINVLKLITKILLRWHILPNVVVDKLGTVEPRSTDTRI